MDSALESIMSPSTLGKKNKLLLDLSRLKRFSLITRNKQIEGKHVLQQLQASTTLLT